jgi:hypothetical protein
VLEAIGTKCADTVTGPEERGQSDVFTLAVAAMIPVLPVMDKFKLLRFCIVNWHGPPCTVAGSALAEIAKASFLSFVRSYAISNCPSG